MVHDPSKQNPDAEFITIRNTALRYLARREHSAQELTQKLISRFPSSAHISAVTDELDAKGYLSDQRYADLIVRSRINAYYGPLRIKTELRAKGVADEVVDRVMAEYDVSWTELAQKARLKHFGCVDIQDIQKRSKQYRYLRNRGFYQDHIDSIM